MTSAKKDDRKGGMKGSLPDPIRVLDFSFGRPFQLNDLAAGEQRRAGERRDGGWPRPPCPGTPPSSMPALYSDLLYLFYSILCLLHSVYFIL